jgi:adenylate cyclase class 2
LGFIQERIYEKWRETFMLENICFCIDKMPFGDFIEIEGDKEKIIQYTSLLNIDWGKRILLNYLDLYEIAKKELNLSFSDITFENFKTVRTDFLECFKANIPLITAIIAKLKPE